MITCQGFNRRGERCGRQPSKGELLCSFHVRGEIEEFTSWIRRVISGVAKTEPQVLAHLFIWAVREDGFGDQFIAELDEYERTHPRGAVAAAENDEPLPG